MLSGILNGWLTSTSLHKGSHPPHPPNKYVEWFINLHFLHKGSNPTPPLNKYVESFMSCHLSSWGIKSPSPSELQLPSGTVKRRVCWVHVFPCKTKQSIRGDRFLQYCFEPEKQFMNSPIAELWHRMYLLEKQALPSEFGATHFNGYSYIIVVLHHQTDIQKRWLYWVQKHLFIHMGSKLEISSQNQGSSF